MTVLSLGVWVYVLRRRCINLCAYECGGRRPMSSIFFNSSPSHFLRQERGGASGTPPPSTTKHWLAQSWVGLVQINSAAESSWVQRLSCPKDISPASGSYIVSFSSPVISLEFHRYTLTHLVLSTSLLFIVSNLASYVVFINCLSLSKAGCSGNLWV